ncbi:MAG: GNAT family N-acetyltransferase [Nitrososphaerota archaeon]|nr:GNAT family N-acetyltransferase [Nitrososphaerota archaeon]MDG7036152.1 GNAT family N-acetyltransferase [Nitrososphaerota archaeon]MDG7037784.1 GNAT family N-acetyltransferase [Nitrososphaerota archaeon]
MIQDNGLLVVDYPPEKRKALEGLLEQSFEGWYLRHSKRTIRNIETVKAALRSGAPVGLAMLKRLDEHYGYVFYIAVAMDERKKGVGGRLLDDALAHFGRLGMIGVYASVEEDNEASRELFQSRKFVRIGFGDESRKHGLVRALMMYRTMRVVPGEILLYRDLASHPLHTMGFRY